jgi:maltooligosyltrehalose trehalohydrolase
VQNLSAHHFIGYIQNHDQIGNRAVGDRLEHIVGVDRTKVALALVFTAPFIPMIFQGEEYAAKTPFQYFAHHEDPEMASAVSAGRKKDFAAFGWNADEIPDPEKRETFERSRQDWSELDQPKQRDMLEWTRSLIRFRRKSTSLNNGDLWEVTVRFDEDKRWLSMQREDVRLICNFGTEPHVCPNIDSLPLALRSSDEVLVDKDSVFLPPDTVAILSREAV